MTHIQRWPETPKLTAGGRDVFRKVLFIFIFFLVSVPRDPRASLHMHSHCVLRALASLLTGGADTLCCARPPARCGNAECETPSCTEAKLRGHLY